MHRFALRSAAAAIALFALAEPLQASPLQQQDSTRRVASAGPRGRDLPLDATRSFDLDTDEGSWISLDVSPDGKTLVFDLLGDLYTMPMSGGEATQLTHGLAYDGQPRFSPDGKTIVFTSDRDGGDNMFTMELASKRVKQITRGKMNMYRSPEWTPDGTYLIVSRGGFSQAIPKLWMYHKDGGGGVQLIRDPAPGTGPQQGPQANVQPLNTVGAAFGKDSRYIWFAQRNGAWEYNAVLPQYQLATYDRETGRRETRTARQGSAFRPTLSPDGKWLVYGSRFETQTGLRLRDLESGDEKWLAYPVQRDDQESRGPLDVLPGMSFTPDSKEIVVSYGGKIWRVPVDGTKPIPVPFHVRTKVEMGPALQYSYPVSDSATFTVHQIRDAVPSPDGKRLAFVALDRLYFMDLPNGTPRRVADVDGVEAQPAWSPDGQWVAYVTWENDRGNLYKVRTTAAGKPALVSPSPALYQQPVWSPNGQRIVAIRGPAEAMREATGNNVPGGATDLVWLPAAGGKPTFITSALGRSRPHFAQDSSRIYFYGNADGLMSVRWDGTDEKRYVRVTGARAPDAPAPTGAAAQAMIMSPTGDQAIAQANNFIYVVTIPMVGEAPSINVSDPAASEFPTRKLTDVGGAFPAWSPDGKKVYWSIGNAFFTYDLDRARVVDDSIAQARRARGDTAQAGADSAGRISGPAANPRGYQPVETRILVRANRDIPEGTVVLRGARILTMRTNSTDEVIERGDVVVRNNRIVAVGATGSVPAPAGARVVDVSGKTIIPGYVDTHSHMWPLWGIHNQQPWMYLANLAYGVTTTRDPQTSTTDVLTYGDEVEAGTAIGPRIYSTGPGIFAAGNASGDNIRDLDHARAIVSRYSKYYDTKTIKMYVAGNRQQRQWIVTAAREQQLMPTLEGNLDFRYNMTTTADGYSGHEHSIPIYPLYKDVVQLYAQSGVTYTPTLIVAYGGPWGENYFIENENPYNDQKLRRFTPYNELAAKVRRRPRNAGWFLPEEYATKGLATVANDIVKAGGQVGIGSHGQLQGLGYHWELWMVQSGGMTPANALRMATLVGARAIGLDKDLGSLEAGKLADLQVLDANPLENIRNTNTIRYVMKNGRLYDAGTLDEIWPRQKKLSHVPGLVDEERPVTSAGINGSK